MWHLGRWFSGGFGSVRLTVGLGGLQCLLQPKRFPSSMILTEGRAPSQRLVQA